MAGKFGVNSADAHMTITNDKLMEHVPNKFKPELEEYLKQHTGNPIGTTGTEQRTREDWFWPALGRLGQRDPVERMKDMDTDGIDAVVLYTQGEAYSIPAGKPAALDGFQLTSYPSEEAKFPLVQAYNDALHEWIVVGKGRLNPVGIMPILPVQEAAKEIGRLARLGFKSVRIPAQPPAGEPPYHDAKWNPLWAAACEADIPVNLHLGFGMGALSALDDPTPGRQWFKSLPPIFMSVVLGQFIIVGPCKNFPKLKIGLVEAGIGWIPYYLDRLDVQWRRHGFMTRQGAQGTPPSSYWRKHFHGTFEDDHAGVRLLDMLGPETIMWADDYPHPDCTWPESQKVIEEHFKDVPADWKKMVTHDNVARVYNLDI